MKQINLHSAQLSTIQSLDTNQELIDSRTELDHLQFLSEFSGLLNFYDLNNKQNGSWKPFLLKDPIFLIASIAKTDYKNYQSLFDKLCVTLKRVIPIPKKIVDEPITAPGISKQEYDEQLIENGFAQLLEIYFDIYSKMVSWTFYMQRYPKAYTLKKYVLQQTTVTFGPLLWALLKLRDELYLLNYIKKPKVERPYAFEETTQYCWTVNKGRKNDWKILQDLREEPDTDQKEGIYQALNEAGTQLISYVTKIVLYAKEEFKVARASKSLYPDTALLRSFVSLLSFYKQQLNGLTEKHLNFYYEEVLKQELNGYKADKAFISLAQSNEDSFQLAAGTAFKAGNYTDGSPILFKSSTATTLNPAKLSNVFTTYKSTDDAKRLYLKEVKNVTELQKTPDGRLEGWDTLGAPTKQSEYFSFVIASPLLLLKEGQRTITLTLSFNKEVSRSFLEKMTFSLSTKKEWLNSPFILKNESELQELAEAIFEYTVPSKQPPIVPFSAEVKSEFSSEWSLLKMTFEEVDQFGAPPELTKITLDVNVDKITNLVLANDFGGLDPAKPFQPLGPTPKQEDNFYLANAEVFSKPFKEFELTVNWGKLPLNFFNYYLEYSAYLIWNFYQQNSKLPTSEQAADQNLFFFNNVFKVDFSLGQPDASWKGIDFLNTTWDDPNPQCLFSENITTEESKPQSDNKDLTVTYQIWDEFIEFINDFTGLGKLIAQPVKEVDHLITELNQDLPKINNSYRTKAFDDLEKFNINLQKLNNLLSTGKSEYGAMFKDLKALRTEFNQLESVLKNSGDKEYQLALEELGGLNKELQRLKASLTDKSKTDQALILKRIESLEVDIESLEDELSEKGQRSYQTILQGLLGVQTELTAFEDLLKKERQHFIEPIKELETYGKTLKNITDTLKENTKKNYTDGIIVLNALIKELKELEKELQLNSSINYTAIIREVKALMKQIETLLADLKKRDESNFSTIVQRIDKLTVGLMVLEELLAADKKGNHSKTIKAIAEYDLVLKEIEDALVGEKEQNFKKLLNELESLDKSVEKLGETIENQKSNEFKKVLSDLRKIDLEFGEIKTIINDDFGQAPKVTAYSELDELKESLVDLIDILGNDTQEGIDKKSKETLDELLINVSNFLKGLPKYLNDQLYESNLLQLNEAAKKIQSLIDLVKQLLAVEKDLIVQQELKAIIELLDSLNSNVAELSNEVSDEIAKSVKIKTDLTTDTSTLKAELEKLKVVVIPVEITDFFAGKDDKKPLSQLGAIYKMLQFIQSYYTKLFHTMLETTVFKYTWTPPKNATDTCIKLASSNYTYDPYLQVNPLKMTEENTEGFLRMKLMQPEHGFGTDCYGNLVSTVALFNGAKLVEDKGDLTEVMATPPVPFVAMMKSISGTYHACYTYDLKNESDVNEVYPLECFYETPFGSYKVLDTQTDTTNIGYDGLSIGGVAKETDQTTNPLLYLPLYPRFNFEGALFLPFTTPALGANLSIYVEMVDKLSVEGSTEGSLTFNYLSSIGWKTLPITSDTTSSFKCSGILTFNFPKDAVSSTTRMPQGFYWICIGTSGTPSQYPQTFYLNTNGLLVQRDLVQVPDEFDPLIEANAIVKTKKVIPEIELITQPFASFGGLKKEVRSAYNTRVSSSLSQKNRVMSGMDFYRMTLQNFPDLYTSQSIFNEDERSILVYCAAQINTSKDPNCFLPLVSACKLSEISTFLKERSSALFDIEARNFIPIYAQVTCVVNLVDKNKGEVTLQKVNEAIQLFLSPWIQENPTTREIGKDLTTAELAPIILRVEGVGSISSLAVQGLLEDVASEDEVITQSITPSSKNILVPSMYNRITAGK